MLSRYASRQLDRVLAAHGITLTEFQLMVTLGREGPARVLALARRLRLDPGPTGRSLARLEQQGVVRRTERWRFSPWALEPAGARHLELLDLVWDLIDESLRAELGSELVAALIRAVTRLPPWVPREGLGWFDE
jgi:DNA-binding MarR family transcriptional regulator